MFRYIETLERGTLTRQASSPDRPGCLSPMKAEFALDSLKKIFCTQRTHTEIASYVEDC
jgi:hypothetical protein